MESIYVLGSKTIFDARFADFENETGYYYDVGFKNFGAVRHNLAGTLTILEEVEANFDPLDLALEGVIVFRTDEESTAAQKCKAYLIANITEWEVDDII